MKVWISRFSLTKGILERNDEEKRTDDYVWARRSPEHVSEPFRLGIDAHTTLKDALAAAEAMRLKKIDSLRKQIDRLEKLRFSAELIKEAMRKL